MTGTEQTARNDRNLCVLRRRNSIVGNKSAASIRTLTSYYHAIGIVVGTDTSRRGRERRLKSATRLFEKLYGAVYGDDNPAAGIALGASATGTNRVTQYELPALFPENQHEFTSATAAGGAAQNIYTTRFDDG